MGLILFNGNENKVKLLQQSNNSFIHYFACSWAKIGRIKIEIKFTQCTHTKEGVKEAYHFKSDEKRMG